MNLPDGYLLQAKKYRLTKTIGQGGFGITYLGSWNTEVKGELGAMKTRVPICIKEYFFKDYCYRDKNTQAVKVHSATGEKLFGKFKEKLIEEANILSAVHHPNIVNVLEVFEENNTAYIVMEYIKGNPLKYLLDNEGALPEYKVIKYTHQIGNALSFVHEKNIVHLDIKPGNILVDQDDNARLIDFGVSKRYDIEEQETSTTTLTLSKGFAAIEQYDTEGMSNFSPAPDIYSLGATMYNLLTGVIPIESILRATKKIVPPSFYNSNISSKTEKAILKAMEIKPENRFRTVNELLVAIDAPIYEFTGNNPAETTPADDGDSTEVIRTQPTSASATPDDEQTIIKSTTTAQHLKKRKKRHNTKRRIILAATILLFAFIGYALYDYLHDDDSQRSVTRIDMPGDIRANNKVDSIFNESPEEPDIEDETVEQPAQNNAVQPVNNTVSQSVANASQAIDNKTSTNIQGKTEPEPVTLSLTMAEKNNYEKQYADLKQEGIIKISNGDLESAINDFNRAAEIAKILEKDPAEIDRLIADCNAKINERAIEVRLAQYIILEPFGDLNYVRRIANRRFGAINAAGEEIIDCIYINSIKLPNGYREFVKEDLRIDVWSIYGRKVESDLPPR